MKPFALLFLGVVVGWAASGVDWNREAVGEESDTSLRTGGAHEEFVNSYYLCTGELQLDKHGVAKVPSRYLWSVETSWRGIDVHGKDLPDTRVMLRLYDPDHNFTALTAQMDLATAAKLQEELASMIDMKSKNPAFQHRPQLYDEKDIPTRSIKEITPEGEVILEEIQR